MYHLDRVKGHLHQPTIFILAHFPVYFCICLRLCVCASFCFPALVYSLLRRRAGSLGTMSNNLEAKICVLGAQGTFSSRLQCTCIPILMLRRSRKDFAATSVRQRYLQSSSHRFHHRCFLPGEEGARCRERDYGPPSVMGYSWTRALSRHFTIILSGRERRTPRLQYY